MLSHTIENPRKEQQFFEDAAIDRMMGTVMALATEVFVLRSRLQSLESQIAKSGLLDTGKLHEAASADEVAATKADAKEYSEALLRPLLGLQDAVGQTD